MMYDQSKNVLNSKKRSDNLERYVAKKEYVLREIAGTSILVSVGNEVANFCGVITLNESACLLWKRLQNHATESELVETLIQNYDIDEAKAKEDVQVTLKLLLEKELISYE